jgi:polyisoprenoid-binding protein YceI
LKVFWLAIVGGLLLFASPGGAAPDYAVDLSASVINVTIFHDGFLGKVRPSNTLAVKTFSGRISLAPKDLSRAKVEIDAEAKSLTNTHPEISDLERRELHSVLHTKVLESERFPQVTFRSVKVTEIKEEGGKKSFVLQGDLTIHGVTKRVTAPVSMTISGGQLRATGETTLKQTDFGMTPYSGGFGMIKIRDEVKVSFNVVAK